MSAGSSTLTKGLGLLRLLGQHPEGAPAAVLARDSGLPFSTAYRLLNTLTASGYAEFDAATRRYRIGLTVLELSQKVSVARGYDGEVRQVLDKLSEVTNESCLFSVRDGHETVTILTVDGPEFRQTTDPGDRLSLHVSSMGKAILAALPEAEAEEVIFEMNLRQRTQHTVVEPGRLLGQISDARRDGYVYQREEVDLGMNAIARAVVGPKGAVLGAVAIAAPLFRADKTQLVAHNGALTEATHRLAVTLPSL